MDIIQAFEVLMEKGKKSSTYKYALLTSIIDYVIENPLEPPINTLHFIPVYYLAKQYLLYYIPLLQEGINQAPSKMGRDLALQHHVMTFLIKNTKQQLFHFSLEKPQNISKFSLIFQTHTLLPSGLVRLLHATRRIILEQPLQHIRNVRGKTLSIFGLFTKQVAFTDPFETHRKQALKLHRSQLKGQLTFKELLLQDTSRLFLSHQSYTQLARSRFWIRDVLIKRWSQESTTRFNNGVPHSLNIYDYWKAPPERNHLSIKKIKQYYLTIGLDACIYCKKPLTLTTIELDHLFPWSIFPNNQFWNLYPSCTSCNAKKTNQIPVLSNTLLTRIKQHLEHIMNSLLKHPSQQIIDDLTLFYQKYLGSTFNSSKLGQTVNELISYIELLGENLLQTIPGKAFTIEP